MPFFEHVFTEVAAVLAVAAAVGVVCWWLRQPLISAFIFVGILVGPVGLDWIHAHDHIDLFAELGIGLLLFVVGLKLEPSIIRSVGTAATVASLGQMSLTLVLGFLLAMALGFTPFQSFYAAAALTFSSTIIIIKLLSDKREVDALHGRIALGILIIQDVVVVFLMLGLVAYAGGSLRTHVGWEVLNVVVKGVGFLALVGLVTRYLLPTFLHSLARSPELIVLFAIAWAIGLSSVGAGLGFSKEAGALLAGASLASTPYRALLAARLVGLRDFLLLFFFIDLGVHIDVPNLPGVLAPALILSLLVLLGKPLMVMGLLGSMGYVRQTATMTGISLGQISEFSLILAALGLQLGHIDQQTVGMITLVGLITIGLSTYMILYAHRLSEWLAPLTGVFERKVHHPEQDIGDAVTGMQVDVIVFGLGRYGRNIARELRDQGEAVLGVDFDPELVRAWHQQGLATLYGDVEDPEIFHSLPLEPVSWVVSTIKGQDQSLVLLHALRNHQFKGRIALTAHTAGDQKFLLDAGADLVLLPFRDAAKEAADKLVGADRWDDMGHQGVGGDTGS
jgi:Kef-type K+ transport system membrane component KefB